MTRKAQTTKAKLNQWDYIKLKNSSPQQTIINRIKQNKTTYRMRENICKSYISGEELVMD